MRRPHASLQPQHLEDVAFLLVFLLPRLTLLSPFVPLVRFLRATHASSLTEPAPKRDNRVSFAVFHVVSSSKPAKMLFPVAPMRSWHQIILDLSLSTSPSWNLCSNSDSQSDSSCCLWSYLTIALIMEFIFAIYGFSFPLILFLMSFLFSFMFLTLSSPQSSNPPLCHHC